MFRHGSLRFASDQYGLDGMSVSFLLYITLAYIYSFPRIPCLFGRCAGCDPSGKRAVLCCIVSRAGFCRICQVRRPFQQVRNRRRIGRYRC